MLVGIKKILKNKRVGIVVIAGMLIFAVLVLGLFFAFGKKGWEKLPNGIGKEIFTDLAAGTERIQEWSEEMNSEMLTLDLGSIREVRYFRLRWDRSVSSRIRSWTMVAWQEEMSEIYPAVSSGEGGLVLYSSDQTPYLAEETVCLSVDVPIRTLRIIVEGADTAPEVSVYAQDPWEQVFASLQPHFEEQRLVTAPMPSWLEVNYAGCRPSAVLDAEGRVQNLLEDKMVHVGYTVNYGDWQMESPDYVLTAGSDAAQAEGGESAVENSKPAVIPELQEWRGREGSVSVSPETVIYAEEEYAVLAQTLAADVSELTGWEWQVVTEGTPKAGDVVLQRSTEESLGEEGYRIELGDTVLLSAFAEKGMYWGSRTFLQMLLLYGDALPKGSIRDYPSYPVRGFEIDVARNSVSMHMLKEMAKTLSWFKVNELTVHLNDNGILAYTEKRDSWDTVYDIYSAFRLESGIVGTNGRSITAQDLFYRKDDFTAFVKEADAMGVRIIPEIDTPAHSLAITSAFPELALPKKEAADMLDLSKEESVSLAKEIWSDAMPAFADCPVVHIGADEYYGDAQEYIDYENTMLDFLTEQGKDCRMWGSLSKIRGTVSVLPRDNTELIIWNTDWADPEEMYREGFALINAWNKQLYLIPGGGYDYLDREGIYNAFQPNVFYREDGSGSVELPEYAGRIRGAQICMWNDLCDELAIGITEYDMFDRLYHALPMFSARCWNPHGTMGYDAVKQSIETIGTAPGSDPYDQCRWGLPAQDFLLGPPYQVEMTLEWILPEGNRGTGENGTDADATSGQGVMILDETERDGNHYILYLRNENGNMGIACEEYEYEWDYEFPAGQKVCLTFQGEKDAITLYVDGESVGTIGSSEPFTDHATFLFPTEQMESICSPLRDSWPPEKLLENGEWLVIHEYHIE